MEKPLEENYDLELTNDTNDSHRKIPKELIIISDLLTDICEESTSNKDTNGPIIKH